jgi:hypothetical protein
MNFTDKTTTRSVKSRQFRGGLLGLLSAAALTLSLTGCALGTMSLSGTEPGQVTSALHVSGTVHGGQNPVTGSAIQLWAVGSTGYGSAATPLVLKNGTGGTCSATPINITAFAIAANVVTLTGTNSLTAGESVTINGLGTATYLNGLTFSVTAATPTTFSFSFTHAAAAGTDTGTATPLCPGVYTDATGSFNLNGTYTCPSASSLIYITATGGNPGMAAGTNNTAIEMMAPLGACSTLANTTVFINEVTTVAGAYALAQYFTPSFGANSSDSFGAPSTAQAQTGIANAFATVNNLVSTSTGNAVTQVNLTGTLSGTAYTYAIVPETAKIYTLANIIASCVNSTSASSSNCTTLFGAVVPTGGVTPTDVLQASVDLALNPTSTNANGSSTNITNLFNLQSPSSPFVGAAGSGLSAAPTDWTLGIQYQDNAGTFFLKPQNIAIDSVGNVWVLSNNSGVGNLVELTPTGTPESNIASLSEYGPFVSPIANPPVLSSPKTTTTTINTQNTVFTTTFGAVASNPSINPRNLAIDPSNNVWFTQTSGTSSTTGGSAGTSTIPASGNVFEIATSATGIPTGSTYGFATGKSAYGLAIDAAGNVFIGQGTSSAYFGIYEFPYNSTPGNALLTPVGFPPPSTTTNFAEYISIDKSGNKIFTNGSATATSAFQITGATASSCPLTANALCQPTGSSYATVTLASGATGPYGLAEGTTGTWIANNAAAANNLSLVPFGTTSGTNFGDANHLLLPKFPAVDGLGNVWVGNGVGPNNTTALTGGSISALTATGAYLSPSNGGSTTIAPGFTHLGLNFPAGTAIDPSGNVWVANNAPWTAACTNPLTTPSGTLLSGGNTCSSVFELVGAAAPVVTPIASQTTNGPTRP